MAHIEILEKAIQKAIDNGWNWLKYSRDNLFNYEAFTGDTKVKLNWQLEKWPQLIIFNHDFAKALWPGTSTVYGAEVIESPVEGEAGFDEYLTLSEYHLQQMVVSDDPIKYLGENI